MKETQTLQPNENAIAAAASVQTGQDVKNAVLIVSLFANLTLFVAWLVFRLSAL